MSFYSKYAGEEVEQRLDAVSEIAGQVGDISGALSEVSGKVGEVSEHLASVDASVVAVGNRVDGVVASVDGVSSRVDANATNIAEVAEKVGSIEKDVDVIDESVGALGERVQELGSLTTSVENLSANVTAIGRGVEQLAERVENVASELDNKQGVLESGVNVKTINGESILGAGDIKVQGSGIGGEVEDVTEIVGNEFVLLMDGDKVLRVPMSVLKAWLGVPSEPSEPDQPDEPTTPDVDENGYIVFADEEVKRVLMANGVSSDGVGITKADAEKVTSIDTWFKGNTVIESFDELEKFTGVTTLNTKAFQSCSSLERIGLDNIITISSGAFEKSGLKTATSEAVITISDAGVESGYWYGAFRSCPSLSLISFPNCTFVGKYAFHGCSLLENIDIRNAKTVGIGAFDNCTGLSHISLLEHLENVGTCAFRYVPADMVVNSSNLSVINGGAFYESGIQTFIASNLTKIDDCERENNKLWGVFENCTNLTNVQIPSIKSIGARAFYNCTSLEIEDLQLPNLETLGQNAFYGVKIKKISNLGKLTAIPDGGTNTSNSTFGAKDTLESIILPETLLSIGRYAFMRYNLITEIIVPNSVTTISMSAFQEVYGLKKLVLGSGVTTIGQSAIRNTNGLELLVVMAETPPALGSGSITGAYPIYVPDASVEAYKGATNWSSYADRIKGISELATDNAELYNEIKDYLN